MHDVALHPAAWELGHDDAAGLPYDLLGLIKAGPQSSAAAEALDEALFGAALPAAGRGRVVVARRGGQVRRADPAPHEPLGRRSQLLPAPRQRP